MNTRLHPTWQHITNSEGVPSLIIPVGSSLDYDGCHGNTDEVMEIVEQVSAENTHLTITQIRNARREIESAHKPFSTVEFIENELIKADEGKTWQRDLRPYIIERAAQEPHRSKLLTVGSAAVIAAAREYGMYNFVTTYGAVADPKGERQKWSAKEWQDLKVSITPQLRDLPRYVSLGYAKGALFESWYVEEMKAFLLPESMWITPDVPLYVRSLIHTDDKITAMSGWPVHLPAYPIHVLPENKDKWRETQLKGVPPLNMRTAIGMRATVLCYGSLRENELDRFYPTTP
jgi:hypothetical protein